MRVIIRVVKRDATDEQSVEMKQAVKKALEKFENVQVNMETME